jgi:cobalamin biosynthesis Mg chelatase CobN
VDRQGSHRFTARQRAVMVREYTRGVLRSGVGCSANTCGNRVLQRYVAGQARRSGDVADARAFQARFDRALRSGAAPKPAAAERSAPRKLLRRAFRLFTVPATAFASAHPAVQIGSVGFLLFFTASLLLGVVQSLVVRMTRRPLVTLNVDEERV